jgi:hypothetical protein
VIEPKDAGSAAVELLVFGIGIPVIIVQASLGLFTSERHAMAAQQLAREAVRHASVASYNDAVRRELIDEVAGELRVDTSNVKLQVHRVLFSDYTSGFEATAEIQGSTETARMRATQ